MMVLILPERLLTVFIMKRPHYRCGFPAHYGAGIENLYDTVNIREERSNV